MTIQPDTQPAQQPGLTPQQEQMLATGAPFDQGNPGVQQPIAAWLTTAQPAPGVLLATIRCGGTTLTVHLGRDDAIRWGRQLVQAGQGMSGLIVAGGGLPRNPPGVQP